MFSRHSRLHCAATNKTARENTDPMRIYHFVTSIKNTRKADKIAKQVQHASRKLQDVFERALTLAGGLQLAEGVCLRISPQVMQVFTSAPCHNNGFKGCIHQVSVRDSQARSNAC